MTERLYLTFHTLKRSRLCKVLQGTWTADNSPYIVQGAIVVNAGETLSVEPGAKAAFEAGAHHLL